MIKNIIFDFDGVIIDSMGVRVDGIKKIFSEYDESLVKKFIEYYRYNAGLSKFIKIKYFYNEILGEDISEERINIYSEMLSDIMKKNLTSKSLLIKDTYKFIINNYEKYNFHIASGSEERELRYLCENLGINKFFKSVKGAPTHKDIIVSQIIEENGYERNNTAIIGDSINDYDASIANEIYFLGYNNRELIGKGLGYIFDFNELDINKL